MNKKESDYEKINHEIVWFLEENKEESYRIFASSLIPGGKKMYGVRIPVQRKLAKKIANGNWKEYLLHARDESFEEVNLQGFVLGYAKGNFHDKEPFIREFIKKIADWSVCDGFCATMKQVKNEPVVWWEFLWECSDSKEEYILRFVLVMWLWYYMDDLHVDQIVQRIVGLKFVKYYDQMAAAWCLAEAFMVKPELIMNLLVEEKLEPFVHQKCIQKICESNKVTKETKEKIKLLRLKSKIH